MNDLTEYRRFLDRKAIVNRIRGWVCARCEVETVKKGGE
jgi:hypothetical protein